MGPEHGPGSAGDPRVSRASCVVRRAWTDPQEVERPMTAGDRPNEHVGLAGSAGLLDQPVPFANRLRREHPHAEDLMLAHKQRRPAHLPTAGPQPCCKLADRIPHLPRALGADRRAKRRLDAMGRADPVRPRDVARRIRAATGAIIRRRNVAGYRLDRYGSGGPAFQRPAKHPLEHEMRHVGRGDDLVVGRTVGRSDGEKPIEECGPLRYNECAIGTLSELTTRPALWIPIPHYGLAIVGLAARFGFRELRRGERPIAPATDDDDVPPRRSPPPSTTRIVPVA